MLFMLQFAEDPKEEEDEDNEDEGGEESNKGE